MSEILTRAKKQFALCVDAESENRQLALEDLKFADGDQWPSNVKAERDTDNRPSLTLNRIPLYIRQVVNDIRQIRPAIKVRPVDGQADPDTAEVLNGMIRAIEQESSAESAYDWAAEYAVKMGFGYWRILTEYCDEGFDQHIRIERVRNPFSVYIDPGAEKQDASDMRYAFVVERMPKEVFEAKYPDARSEWDEHDAVGGDREWWVSDDFVRVAEYWECVEEEVLLSQVMTELGPQVIEGEVPEGLQVVNQRTIQRKRVSQRIITGAEILEENEWAGKYIPIIRVLGRETDIEGKVYLRGMVRDLKDPMRQYNYMRSAAVERIALAPKAPYIGARGAFADRKWRDANRKNYSHLEYEPQAGSPPPSREAPPDISPGLANEAATAAEELKAITGIFNAGQGDRSPEVSGVAIDSRRSESDVSNFDFVDNLARAMTFTGKVLVDLIPKIYTGPRAIRILKPGNQEQMIQVNQPYIDQQTQKPQSFMLEVGKYDVSVDIGPSYATQRKEASESMLELLKAFPQAAPVLGDLAAQNFDWPEADEIAKRLKLLLPPEILKAENPAIAQMIAQKDQQVEMANAQAAQLQQLVQALNQKLQEKDRDLQIKAAEVQRKAQADKMSHIEGMTELELEAAKDLGPVGVGY